MCGIIGYTGKRDARKIIIDGLYDLEYRGYDSAGMAVLGADGKVTVAKCGGRVSKLDELSQEQKLSGTAGIGHTRWATHGKPNETNAHPHSSENLVLVHNGIIDNCVEIRKDLEARGYVFRSETDTEAVAHLIDSEYKAVKDPVKAIRKAIAALKGSYALCIMFYDIPGTIYAVRKDNPLIVATTDHGNLLASDIPAILKHSRDIYRPAEGEIIEVTGEKVTVYGKDGTCAPVKTERIDWNVGTADKEGYPYFMLKEINEEPDAIRRCVSHRVGADGLPDFAADGVPEEFWRSFDSIQIISCGSATHAGYVGRYLIETMTGMPVTVNTASEYRYDPPATVGRTLAIAISQSGETADTLAGLRLAKEKGFTTLGIINVFGSAIARESDYVLYTNAGPEIAVATTKGYTTQVAMLSLIACKFAYGMGKMAAEDAKKYCASLANDIPVAMKKIIDRQDEIRGMAACVAPHDDVYFIGRGPDSPAGIECSLKLKEISYIHSEAYAAGELKHGTLSLVEEGTPVVAICSDSRYYDKMNGNIREVRSRGGFVILINSPDFPHPEEFSDRAFEIPAVDSRFTPMLSVLFSQILAYETALIRGCDVDHPRNLAKSVTVE